MMKYTRRLRLAGVALAAACWSAMAGAALPPPTPEQAQAAAEKKAKADAQAQQEKQELLATMDTIAARWRSRAAVQGYTVHPPVQLAAQSAPAPVRSEKLGTAPPSADVKQAATPSLPAGTRPASGKPMRPVR
ncbi:hypothetical protein [Massilia horti]|uniref:Uncharacterized protein n=1 Tax=Massilia horti TaxID=2562153 RepID=A0A4Y9T628_9BURK|nr:hypothetical protein [Massilia horti]TFW32568.1 hypothetical protein E4O92_09400 [Massilia horti]